MNLSLKVVKWGMKIAPTIVLLIMMVLAPPLGANTWVGTITWTLTSLNHPDPGGQIGDSFTGSYTFESPTADFDSNTYEGQYTFSHLSGQIAVPTWMTSQGFITFPDNNDALAVHDGVVTFSWGFDFGPLSMNWSSTSMNFGDVFAGPDGSDLTGTGSVVFSTPVDPPSGPPSTVPDSGATALLLGIAVAGLVIGRNQKQALV